ncbi:MAG: alpha/beta fold hydrolase [Pseudomonadota bacterium]
MKRHTLQKPDGSKLAAFSFDAKDPGGNVPSPSAFFIHGAGKSHARRTDYLSEWLAGRGIASTSFDQEGHGESEGALEGSSLARRAAEADFVHQTLSKGPLALVAGSSMGGHLAIRKGVFWQSPAIALFCPAVYGHRAWDLAFGAAFRDFIRKPGSFRQSDALEALSGYQGRMAVFIGADDEVIPSEVLDLLAEHAKSASFFVCHRIPGCTHLIHRTAAEDPRVRNVIFDGLEELLAG